MKKWLQGRFCIPEGGKVTEKVLISRVGISVAIIVLCMLAMSFTAYGYFSCSVTSGMNQIRSANYDLSISINGTPLDGRAAALPAGSHTVRLDYGGTASTGFCVVKLDGVSYHTVQIGVDQSADGGKRESVSFTLVVESGSVEVVFVPHWGTSSCYAGFGDNEFYITDGESVYAGSIDGTESTTAPAQPDPPELVDGMYEIRSGDTLFEIAQAFGTTVERIAAYNGLNVEDYIYAGAKIAIPPEDWVIPGETT